MVFIATAKPVAQDNPFNHIFFPFGPYASPCLPPRYYANSGPFSDVVHAQYNRDCVPGVGSVIGTNFASRNYF